MGISLNIPFCSLEFYIYEFYTFFTYVTVSHFSLTSRMVVNYLYTFYLNSILKNGRFIEGYGGGGNRNIVGYNQSNFEHMSKEWRP